MTVVVNSQQGSSSNATAATTQAITPTGIVTGRSLVLLVGNAGGGATGTLTGVADTSGSNVWTVPGNPNGGVTGVTNTRMGVAYCHNVAAPGTITATMGSIGSRKLILLEITGLQNAAPAAANQDITAAAALTNNAPSVNPGASAAFAIALCVRGGTVDPTGITAGWTASTSGLPDNTTPILRGGWQEFPSGGATGVCGFTFAASAQAGLGMIAFLVAATPDAWAMGTATSRSVPFYKGSVTVTANVFDPAANSFADWTPQPSASRSVKNYRGGRSSVMGAADEPIIVGGSTWAGVTQDWRAPLRYQGQPSLISNVFDPATNTFADWTPPALLSRPVKNYSPPAAQPVVSWGYSIITDQFAPVAQGRVTPLYVAPRSLVEGVFFAPAASSSDYAAAILSRQVASYRGGPSTYWVAWDDHACTTLLPDTLLFPDSVLFPDLCAQVELAPTATQGRKVPFYRAPPAVTISVFDPASNTFADWTPQPVASRPVPRYGPLPSNVVPLAWGASIVTDAYAPVAMDGAVPFYHQPPSLVIGTFDQAVAGTWASVTQSFRAPFRYLGSPSLALNVYDPATNTFADWAPSALISRMVAFYRGPRGQTVLVFPAPIVIPDQPAVGGGHTFILRMRDPFTEKQGKPAQATDPFVDPFTMKKPKGVR